MMQNEKQRLSTEMDQLYSSSSRGYKTMSHNMRYFTAKPKTSLVIIISTGLLSMGSLTFLTVLSSITNLLLALLTDGPPNKILERKYK